MKTFIAALVGAVALTVAVPVAAQSTTDTTTTQPVEREDDNEFPWGLLGLLGLAGLIPRKRETHVHPTDTTRR